MTVSLCTCKKIRKQVNIRLLLFSVTLYGLFCLIIYLLYPGTWAVAAPIGIAFAVYLLLVIKNLKAKHTLRCSLRKSFIDLMLVLPSMLTNV